MQLVEDADVQLVGEGANHKPVRGGCDNYACIHSICTPTVDQARLELTMTDMLFDPMIGCVNIADGVSRETYMQLLESASRVMRRRGGLVRIGENSIYPNYIVTD